MLKKILHSEERQVKIFNQIRQPISNIHQVQGTGSITRGA